MSSLRISVILPCYRNSTLAIATLHALGKLPSLHHGDDEIIVVDDGSDDGSAERIAAACGEGITLLSLERNQGRSFARNLGAQSATRELLFFLDPDCLPATAELLDSHRLTITSGNTASIGPVTGTSSGFWHRYQQQASVRRERLFKAGAHYVGSSQNFAVLRSAFMDVGGFDPAYVQYGFEDRDLLLRLSRIGSIAWTAAALVQHMDELSLQGVSSKMLQAGGASAWRFHQQHPEAYRRLGYAALDCRLHSWLRLFARLAGPCLPWLSSRLDKCLELDRLPWPMRKMMVKLVSALSFAYGTTRPLD